MQYISQDRLPLTRFFTKYNLIYIPFIGQAFYFLDFPMMRRHSKEAIAKNPSLKDRDILEAKRACELLKDKPLPYSIIWKALVLRPKSVMFKTPFIKIY